MSSTNKTIRPPLKWAGGKARLVTDIKQLLPITEDKRLIEPFVGAGALFLNSDYPKYWLNDINADLILFYKMLKKHKSVFIDQLQCYFIPENNTKERYYQFREQFNQAEPDSEKAALFFYLNRHAFNGLCRYNSKGGFNAPFGYYKKPFFPAESLAICQRKLQQAKLTCLSFEKVMQQATTDDVLYCDPPYIPLTDSAYFTKYHASSFALPEQQTLAQLAGELKQQNIPVLISNHDTPLARELYCKAELHSIEVARSISCQAENRQSVAEILARY